MPYCGNCGNSIIENQNYSPNCGQRAAQSTALVRNGTICSYCQKPIEKSEKSTMCPQCRAPHHQECWQENGGCSVFGCGGLANSGLGSEAIIPDGDLEREEPRVSASTSQSPYYIVIAAVALCAIVVAIVLTQETEPDPDHIPGTIHEAAERGDTEAVEQYLQSGVDVNVKDDFGQTPLHMAAYEGHTETARLLLENGADVNARDDFGFTPLHEAAVHTKTAELLREYGAIE